MSGIHQNLQLNPAVRTEAISRLRSVKGHVEGIIRMLETDSVYCVDVLKQIKAVDGAMIKIGDIILRSHLHDHVVTAEKRGDTNEIIEELMEILKYR
ncbi:MAG: metal-sensitive transcriptional regulator [Nitrospiraceae bacterium]